MSETPVDPQPKKPDASWLPVLMSVAVYPGIGQWMQKRQTAGSIYVAFFTIIAALFAWTLFIYLREVISVIQEALNGTADQGTALPPLGNILKPFAVVLFIYLGNVVDVLRGRFELLRNV